MIWQGGLAINDGLRMDKEDSEFKGNTHHHFLERGVMEDNTHHRLLERGVMKGTSDNSNWVEETGWCIPSVTDTISKHTIKSIL